MVHSTWADQQVHWSCGVASLASLAPFTMLPSMLTLNGTVLGLRGGEVNHLWLNGIQASTVTHLNLNYCKLPTATLAAFLARLSSLRSFMCCFARSLGTLGTPPNLSVVRLALLESASSTLEDLAINTHHNTVDGRFNYIGSLREFKVLKTISLDADLLSRDGRFQHLEKILPSSVEVLRIGLHSTGQEFQDLPELKQAHFPVITEVTTYYRSIDDNCMCDRRYTLERCESCHIATGEW